MRQMTAPPLPPESAMAAPDDIELLPATGAPTLLFIVLHGYGAGPADMLPLARQLHDRYPQSAVLVPAGFAPGPFAGGFQWFSLEGISEANRPARVAAALPALRDYVRAQQARFGIVNPDTALAGFSQGAIMALELASAEDGLVGRVLAFAGRYATLPVTPPQLTSLHLFHGEADDVVAVAHSRRAFEHLAAQQGDATVDLASGVGHELHPVLVARALDRLQSLIPLRTWRRALGGGD